MPITRVATISFVLAILTLVLTLWIAFSPEATGADARDGSQKTPNYQIMGEYQATGVHELDVTTTAKREARMRLVAEDLRKAYTPENGTLLIEYHDAKDPSNHTGFALVYDNKRAVLEAGRGETSGRFGDLYDTKDARQIMDREDGIRVVGFLEFTEQNPSLSSKIESFLD